MRINTPEFDAFNQASVKELRLVVVIDFPDPLYLSSHADIPNLPAGALAGVLQDVSSISQRLVPDEGRSEIGSMSFTVIDKGGAVTDRFRTEQQAGNGLKFRKVQLYRGGAGMDWSAFRLEQTQQIDRSVEYHDGAYQVHCSDIQRSLRQDIFDLAKTKLAATLEKGATTLTVASTADFQPCTHVASFGDEPSGSFFYLKIKYNNGFEIVRATGKTATTFTGLARGLFGTQDVTHDLPANSDADSGVEVEEYVYLELPAPAMVYALLTGDIIGGGTIPDRWHLDIDPSLVHQDTFENIGEDWFVPGDYSQGLIFRFQAIDKTDGKRFIEEEVCLLMGAYLRVGADGKLSLRRMTGVIGSADWVAEINEHNAIAHGPLQHDLSAVRNVYDIEWSWVDISGDEKPRFVRRNVLVDQGSIAVHGESPPLTLQFKGLHAERHTLTTLAHRFDALRDRYAGPPELLNVDLLPSMNDIEVGDIVRVRFPTLRDYSGTGTLDRSFEVERISVDQNSGRVSAELFGSSRKADPIADDGAGADAELPDGWYDSFGTDMTEELSIDQDGFLEDDGELAGGTTTRTAYYYLGDFTVPVGRTLTVTGNVQLHIRGHFQVNGTVIVTGGTPADTNGFLGSTAGGRGITIRDGIVHEIPGPRRVGAHQVMPAIEVENHAGTLAGIPADMRGTGGAAGGDVWEWDGDEMVSVASGGVGGAGGGSLVVVSRGAGYGVSGQCLLSGADGNAGTSYDGGPGIGNLRSGSGGGGAPGCLLHVLDGSQVAFPVLATAVVAEYGTSPVTQGVAGTPGKAPAEDPVDLGIAAARVVYVPKSREPYPDFDNDALNPDAVSGFLSHEAHVASAAADGSGYSLTGAGGTFRVFRGITEKTGAGPVYSVVGSPTKNGLTMAINSTTGVYTLSGANWTSDGEFFTLRATYLDVAIDKTYAIAKARRGQPFETTYYIKPVNGTAIHNHQGTLTIEARRISTAGDELLSSGNIKLFDPDDNEVTEANGYAAGSDGYTGVLNAGNINGAKVITLKNGPSGDPLDTITLVDIADGADGEDGAPGDDAVYGYIEPENGLAWTRGQDAAAWTPSQLTTDLDCTFVQGGADVARISRRVTLNPLTGNMTVSTTTHPGGNLNTGRVTVSVLGEGTASVTVRFAYSSGGFSATVAETVKSVQSGLHGSGVLINGSFETGTLEGWTAVSGSWQVLDTNPRLGTYHAQSESSQALVVLMNDARLQVDAGERVLAYGFTRRSQSAGAQARQTGVRIYWFDANDDIVSFSAGPTTVSTSYQLSRIIATAPAGVAYARFAFVGLAHSGNNQPALGDGAYMDIMPRDGDVNAPGFVKMQAGYEDTAQLSAGIVFTTDGRVLRYNNGTPAEIGTWWSNAPETGIGSSYQVRCRQSDAAWDFSPAANGTYVTISSDLTWRITRTEMEGSGSDFINADFEIRAVGGTTVEDSTFFTAEAFQP